MIPFQYDLMSPKDGITFTETKHFFSLQFMIIMTQIAI